MQQLSIEIIDSLPDEKVEFIEDPEITQARLEKIKLSLSDLAEEHMPFMAYLVLLDAVINHLRNSLNKMFYFPIPWETDTGLPSQPSLIADARHYCRVANLSETTGVIVDSFAEWRLFKEQKVFCCCGKGSVISRERIVPIEIVIHHPVSIDREAHTLEIKQLVGIRSTDRDHIENHYDLRLDSRVNSDISIIKTGFVKIDLANFKLIAQEENSAKQFDLSSFRNIFTSMYHKATLRPT
ncbi:MAG: hypothetical protein Q8Q89_00955 [bacterium]|nr:hypothetical protein [bacterium]